MSLSLCNYKIYDWPPTDFVFNTCLLCHIFLFNGAEPPSTCKNETMTDSGDGSSRIRLLPQAGDSLSLHKLDLDCSHLSKVDCIHWRQCCEAADACCKSQLSWQDKMKTGTVSTEVAFVNSHTKIPSPQSYCQPTWDGFSCFNRTKPGTKITRRCPSFYNAASGGFGHKYCEANGTWFAKDGLPWTDYSECIPSVLSAKFTVGLTLSCLSVFFLAISLATFLGYKQLWRQIRIKIHASLFLAILLYNLSAIPNDVVFVLFWNQDTELIAIAESLPWAACLAGMRFFKLASFSWMFCEGLYLLRLLRNGLCPPRRHSLFYAIGWGFPIGIISVYYMAKWLVRDYMSSQPVITNVSGGHQSVSTFSSCDKSKLAPTSKYSVEDTGTASWIEWWVILLPCLLTLLANYCFLLCIVRIMTTSCKPKIPNANNNDFRRVSLASIYAAGGNSRLAEKRLMEREGTKKATRAIFLLSPLLGTYVLFTVFPARKPQDMSDEKYFELSWLFTTYELIQAAADRIQGIAVSIAFCLSTKEVLDLYSRSLLRRNVNPPAMLRRRSTRQSSSGSKRNSEGLTTFPKVMSEPVIIEIESAVIEAATSNRFQRKKISNLTRHISEVSRRSLDVIRENIHAEANSEDDKTAKDSPSISEADDDYAINEAILIKTSALEINTDIQE